MYVLEMKFNCRYERIHEIKFKKDVLNEKENFF